MSFEALNQHGYILMQTVCREAKLFESLKGIVFSFAWYREDSLARRALSIRFGMQRQQTILSS